MTTTTHHHLTFEAFRPYSGLFIDQLRNAHLLLLLRSRRHIRQTGDCRGTEAFAMLERVHQFSLNTYKSMIFLCFTHLIIISHLLLIC